MGTARRKVRVNMTLCGELADRVVELQNRGLITSVADAVRLGLLELYEKFQRADLRAVRLRAILKESEDLTHEA